MKSGLAKQGDGDAVGEGFARAGKGEVGGGEVDEAVLGELVEERALGRLDEFEWEALEGADLKAKAFGAALLGGEVFVIAGGEVARLEAGDVSGGVAHVLPALPGNGAGAAGSEAEVILAEPVGGVMSGLVTGAGVVGDLVMGEAGGFEEVERGEKVVGVLLGQLTVGAAGEAVEEFGVFFVVEVVGGDVVGRELEGAVKGVFPGSESLTGNGEHEVDVDAVEAGLTEGAVGSGGLGRRVVAAKGGESGFIPGLDAEADAGDAVGAEKFGFFWWDSAGVGLEGELGEVGEIDEVLESGEQVVEMGFAQESGGATAEVEGLGLEGVAGSAQAGLGEEGVDEGRDVGAAWGVLEEGAVRADAMTERDVQVAVAEGRHGVGSVRGSVSGVEVAAR